jgi:hypothetical protein
MGSEGFEAYLDDVTARVEAAIPGASFKAMTHLHRVAVNRTPLESGDLRGESYVEATPNGADVVYPGPYARYQHYEILRHEVGERLFLTSSVESETPKVFEILAQEIHKAIE